MRAVDVLCEFDDRLAAVEQRAASISRTLTTLEGMRLMFSDSLCSLPSDADRAEALIIDYRVQLDELTQELSNLAASHRETMLLLDRLPPRHNHILSWVHLAGRSVYEFSKELGISKDTAYRFYDRAVEEFDSLLNNISK